MHRISRLKVVVVLATIGVLLGVMAPAGAISDNPTLDLPAPSVGHAA